MRKQIPRICGIYAIIHKPSGKTYIGQSKDIEARFTEHVTYAQKDNSSESGTPLNRALRKHPLEEFSFEILKSVSEEDADKLDWWERYYIRKYDTITPNGYNVEAGGHRGTEDTKLYRLDNKPIAGIYLLTCLPTGKRYVGQSKNILKRIESHWSRMNNDKDNGYNTPLHKEMRKHPRNEWTFHLLEVVNDDELDLLDEFEQEFIEKYDTSFPNGYNVMGGGQKNKKAPLNEEAKMMMLPRKVQRQRIKTSQNNKQQQEKKNYSRKKKNDYSYETPKPNTCKECGKPIAVTATYCIDCYKKNRRKNMPEKQELLDALLRECSFHKVSEQYGVSERAVSKWTEKLGLPTRAQYYKVAKQYGIESEQAKLAEEESKKERHIASDEEIISAYEELGNLKAVGKALKTDKNRIKRVLAENGYDITQFKQLANKKMSTRVVAIPCKKGKRIEFDSLTQAAVFLREHNYTQAKSDYNIRTHIKECAEGTRKTFLGFKWEYL